MRLFTYSRGSHTIQEVRCVNKAPFIIHPPGNKLPVQRISVSIHESRQSMDEEEEMGGGGRPGAGGWTMFGGRGWTRWLGSRPHGRPPVHHQPAPCEAEHVDKHLEG